MATMSSNVKRFPKEDSKIDNRSKKSLNLINRSVNSGIKLVDVRQQKEKTETQVCVRKQFLNRLIYVLITQPINQLIGTFG